MAWLRVPSQPEFPLQFRGLGAPVIKYNFALLGGHCGRVASLGRRLHLSGASESKMECAQDDKISRWPELGYQEFVVIRARESIKNLKQVNVPVGVVKIVMNRKDQRFICPMLMCGHQLLNRLLVQLLDNVQTDC